MENVYKLLDPNNNHELSEEDLNRVSSSVSRALVRALKERTKGRQDKRIWVSDIGEDCLRKTWYKYHRPDLEEDLQPHSVFKFLYGDVIESLVLGLLRAGPHVVEGEQEKIEVPYGEWVVAGRKDLDLDGVVTDIKSTSTYGFRKYTKEGVNPSTDTFGYRWQVSFYDRYTRNNGKANIIFIDKQLGHIKQAVLNTETKEAVDSRVKDIILTVSSPTEPIRRIDDVPYGKSGNMALDTKCSYCPFKLECWKDKGIKGYAYSSGPVWLTEIVKEPNVPVISSTYEI